VLIPIPSGGRRRIQPSIPGREWPNRRRRPDHPSEVHEVSEFRWKVERSHGWLDNWRRLVTRYDRYTQNYVAFLTIACFMVAAMSRGQRFWDRRFWAWFVYLRYLP
jgi:transposase